MIDGPDAVVAEKRGENALEHFAIRQHVRDAAGHAKIVFEHGESAVGQTDQIGAADADVDIARNVEAAHFSAEVLAAIDEFARDDAFREDAAFVIDVAEKMIQRGEALGKSFLDLGPLAGGNNARQKVVREDALRAFLAAVNGEGDSFM